ncbi:MAG: sugar ABC transporter permease [Chloroflexi bacterium]|nr:sugar ABC transporter permease [Chloroflexota bacterium]
MRRFRWRPATREALEGYLWLSPWLIGFLIFTLGPVIASLYLSFTAYHPARTPEWVGLENYIYAFTKDEQFWPSLGRTFYYAVLLVPLAMAGSLALALLLNQPLKANSLYRTAYFLPYVTPVVAAALLWGWILNPRLGILNYALSLVGIQGPSWLSAQWAIPTVVIISLWTLMGGSRMIVVLAALKNVPEELYEAARIDGAGPWRCFWHITLPMISPTLFFNLIVTFIAALKVFEIAYMLTIGQQGGIASGSAGFSIYFYVVKLFDHAFNFFEMGYASAMAWIFLVLVLFFTAIQFKWSSSWVYYAGEDRSS